MTGINNMAVRNALSEHRMCIWELADLLGVSEATVSRRLRHEMSAEDQARLVNIIATGASDNTSQSNRKLMPSECVTSIKPFERKHLTNGPRPKGLINNDLRTYIWQRGITQDEIAWALGISKPGLVARLKKELNDDEKHIYMTIADELHEKKFGKE